ncbi:MAG: TylF/MycF/NovP-related O-methyltransferase [Patescibacteria group bacterium]
MKAAYRKFFPVPKSPYTIGEIADICAVNLVPPERLKSFFTDCIERLRGAKGEDIGDYLEFGAFNGSSLSSMYLTCKQLGAHSTRFFGFDAFQGLPEGAEHEDDGVWKKGFYSCSYEKLLECLRGKSVNPDDIHFVKGWYDQTLNSATVEQLNIKNIGVVFVDCDTYSSSKAVFEFLAPLITAPAIICCDDWKLNDLDIKGMGEYKSFNEFVETNPQLRITEIESYNRKSKSFFVEPV